MTDQTTSTGIQGNTQNGAIRATAARPSQRDSWQESWLLRSTVAITLVVLSIGVYTSVEWTFFWKLVTGAGIIYLAGHVARLPKNLSWYWPNILRGIGGIIIVITLASSSFTYWTASLVDNVERTVGGNETSSIPLSEDQQTRRLQRAQQDAELAAVQAAERAAAQERARIARERAIEESMEPAKSNPCLRRNTDQLNCTTVTFGPGPDTYYDRQAPERHCILPDVPPSRDPNATGFREIDLGGGQKRYRGPSGLTVQFFDLLEGKSFRNGRPCRIPS